jgi:hypothetical protein
MVVGELRLAATAPKAVITAATWMSLWVSTPRMTSSAALGLWSGWAGWGMLGTVVWLLTARERSAIAGPARVVRTVTVPCCGRAPIGTHLPVRRQHVPPRASGRQIKHKAPWPVVTRVRPRPGTAPAHPHSRNG